MNINDQPRTANFLTRWSFQIVGVDLATMRLCGDRDWDNVRAISVLLIATTAYQAAVLCVVTHKVLASDGQIHFLFILGDVGVASLIALIDSFVFLRAGIYADGIAELARGGLDLSGGKSAKAKATLFLVIRILFSLSVAQLTAIGSGLSLFATDINVEVDRQFQQQNAGLISEAKLQIDGQIQRSVDEVKAQELQVASTAQQLASMRQGAVTSPGDDSSFRSQQDEVNLLLTEKLRRDSELVAAQTFAANEWSGVKSDPSNSGLPGRGPVRRGAEERVRAATANVAAANRALAQARGRLAIGRRQAMEAGHDRSRQAQTQTSDLATELQTEKTQLASSQRDLKTMIATREGNIRAAVENAPDRAGRDQGILAQLKALRAVARDPEIAAVIFLIDAVSFMLEAAAVFAKIGSLIPSTYAALIARDAWMRTVRIVDGMMAELDRGPDPESIDPKWSAAVDALDPAFRTPPSVSPTVAATQPVKRPRGRPRKPRPGEAL